MSILLSPIVAAHSLISYASQKHSDKSYMYYQGGVGIISYIESLLTIIAKNPTSSYFNVKSLFIAPTIPSIMRMGTGYIIGSIAYDCMK